MNYINELKQLTIIVLGAGVSGLSTARFLSRYNIPFTMVDSRENPPNQDELVGLAENCAFGALNSTQLTAADMIIISPGIALSEPSVAQAAQQGVEIIGDIELFARLNSKPVYAVTGSNGKSSVVTLTRDVLRQAGFNVALAGNIGTPVLDVVDQEFDCFVLELSSFQLETTHSLHTAASAYLNLSEDHMDRYADLASYGAAKQRIFMNTKLAVHNFDDAATKPQHAVRDGSFGLSQGDYYLANGFFVFQGQPILETSSLAVLGSHNQLNALAVMVLLHDLNLDPQVFMRAFNQFKGLPHRCQIVAEHQGVTFINDSKATNIGATCAALESLSGDARANIILIAGGDGKGADFNGLTPYLEKYVKQLVCIGKDGAQIAALKAGSTKASSMKEAVAVAIGAANDGDIVLLAPACASLDMYSNFMARGDDFSTCVLEAIKP
jgi:UDP-N-acetylmuramoylalanine--D-glutamate ligase